ncbi:MAG: type III pantothenate kinase [Candidatus Omnitrophota bacterium]
MRDVLAIDIGNTNITMGLFSGDKLVKKLKVPTNSCHMHGKCLRSMRGIADPKGPDAPRVIISSVVPLALSRLIAELNRVPKPEISIVGRDRKAPIKNPYRNRDEVGQDRLVNAFAAKTLYGSPSVIIDFGTAITFDIVSRGGDYLGGLILPGIEMSLLSLYMKTALLPKVELKPVSSIVGRDTASSIRGGILFGIGAMCDGLSAKYRKLLGKNTVIIATGGNAGLIRRYTGSIRIVDEDLTLKGLKLISGL